MAIIDDSPEPVERRTAKRRAALGVAILKGETTVAEAARQPGLTIAEIESWQDRFLVASENALRNRPKDEDALKDAQIKQLRQR